LGYKTLSYIPIYSVSGEVAYKVARTVAMVQYFQQFVINDALDEYKQDEIGDILD
jgi:hypothetical protein